MNELKLFFARISETSRNLFRYPNKLFLKVDYDSYWKSKRGDNLSKLDPFQENRIKVIKKLIKKKNKTIKDIGCGNGSLLLYLDKELNFSKKYGTDISKDILKHIKKVGIEPIKLDLNKLDKVKELPKTNYTLILEVLEHIPDSEEVLLELLKKTENSLFFSVPNTGYIGHRLRLLFGSFPLQWRINPSEHLRFWTFRDMKWWLKNLKLESKSKIYLYEGIPFLNKIWPSLFSMGMIIEVKLKSK